MTTTPDTITIGLDAGSTLTVTAHPTATPGLIVHDLGLFGDQWRLTHQQSGCHLDEFDTYDAAQAAARALYAVTDWTLGADALQSEDVIWQAIDSVEQAGGRFLPRKGGLGERVAAKRAAYLNSKENTTA